MAYFSNGDGETQDDTGILVSDGTALTQIARVGNTAPDGSGVYSFLYPPAITDAGLIAFSARTTSDNEHSEQRALFLSDGATLKQIVRQGDAIPHGNGSFSGFTLGPVPNDAGEVAFLSGIEGGNRDIPWDGGIFVGDGESIAQIARVGDAPPDGVGAFSEFSVPQLNNAGQVAFSARIVGVGDLPLGDKGVYLFDGQLGLIQAARVGDALLGSTIVDLGFDGPFVSIGEDKEVLNNRGQLTYLFILADGRQGIAVWSIPEPSSLALLALGGLPCIARRRRHGR